MAKTLTPAQLRVLDAIRAGTLTRADTETPEGRIVERLIAKGAVRFERTVFQPSVFVGWSRRTGKAIRIGSTRVWVGLTSAE